MHALNKSILTSGLIMLSFFAQANTQDIVFNEMNKSNAAQLKTIIPPLSQQNENGLPYQLFVHNKSISDLINVKYNTHLIAKLLKETESARKLEVIDKPWGSFIQAASFANDETANNTHYNAIWVRDSLWGYLSLIAENPESKEAKKVLLTLWDYFSTNEQLKRIDQIVSEPSLIHSDDSQMLVPHIRFDSSSPSFEDVYENKKTQKWNHKQNDALGLLVDCIIESIKRGEITQHDWRHGKRIEALYGLVQYFNTTKFYTVADSGSWEENERLNTSSIALTTSAMENVLSVMKGDTQSNQAILLRKDLLKLSRKHHDFNTLSSDNLERIISEAYEVIFRQINLGGESPDYPSDDKRYRTADAALLNLIYPAKLSRLTLSDKEKVLSIVGNLIGPYGIRRYHNDNYQSANFWFNNIKTDTDEESHSKRENSFIPHTEAEWFFDSWYATAALKLYSESKDKQYLSTATKHINRSLAQFTGKGMKGADGNEVIDNALPESYNYIYNKGYLTVAPSPIIPLNWAKSSMTIMLHTAINCVDE